jgi:tRNA threonylcarbamoyladenosine biosynthesis protein TsaB
LVKNEKIIAEFHTYSIQNHAAQSVYLVNEILKGTGHTAADITDIYCGYGPGSYTGIRISVTIAKMIASFTGANLHAVSSLFLLGSGYDNINVAVMIDARRGNSFCACYGINPIEDKLRNTSEFIDKVSKFKDIKLVNERNFKINPLKVFTKAEKVEDVEAFVPNYLRITEAEYNLRH